MYLFNVILKTAFNHVIFLVYWKDEINNIKVESFKSSSALLVFKGDHFIFFSFYQKPLLILPVVENWTRMRKTGITREFPILLMLLWWEEVIAKTTEYTPTILAEQCKARCAIKVNQKLVFLLKNKQKTPISVFILYVIRNKVQNNCDCKKYKIISLYIITRDHGTCIWLSWL